MSLSLLLAGATMTPSARTPTHATIAALTCFFAFVWAGCAAEMADPPAEGDKGLWSAEELPCSETCGDDQVCRPPGLWNCDPRPTHAECLPPGEHGDFCLEDGHCGSGLECRRGIDPASWVEYGNVGVCLGTEEPITATQYTCYAAVGGEG